VPTLRYRSPQISYDIAHNQHRLHSRKHWSVHAFAHRCSIWQTTHINDNNLLTWLCEWTATPSPIRNNTNAQTTHASAPRLPVGADNGITFLMVSFSSPVWGRLAVCISHTSVHDYRTGVRTGMDKLYWSNPQTVNNRYSLARILSLCECQESLKNND